MFLVEAAAESEDDVGKCVSGGETEDEEDDVGHYVSGGVTEEEEDDDDE